VTDPAALPAAVDSADPPPTLPTRPPPPVPACTRLVVGPCSCSNIGYTILVPVPVKLHDLKAVVEGLHYGASPSQVLGGGNPAVKLVAALLACGGLYVEGELPPPIRGAASEEGENVATSTL